MFLIRSFLLLALLPYIKKTYPVRIAKSTSEKEKIFKFRYQIYRTELSHHFLDETVVQENMLFDEYDFMDNSLIFYCGHIDNILGTVRLTIWDKQAIPDEIREKYYIDHKILDHVDRVGELRFMQVAKKYRKSLLAISLFSSLIETNSMKDAFHSDILFSDCQPGLLNYYFNLGCFPYTEKIFEKYGILQVPIAVALYDLNYMKSKSILYGVLKRYYRLHQKRAKKMGVIVPTTNFQTIIPHLELYFTPDQVKFYRNNIRTDKDKKNFDFILTLAKKFIVLTIRKGYPIIRKDLVDYDMYLLLEGVVGIFMDDILIAQLTPGSILGEMALLDEKHKRYTDAISVTDVKVLMISRNTLFSCERKNPRLANHLLHVLCNNLSDKIASANKILFNNFKK